jgi:hypothetical protein
MSKYKDFITYEEPENKIRDIMGNVLLRGHVIAFSKAGRGERSLNLGVITHITKRKGNSGYGYSLWTTGSYEKEHQVGSGCESSVVLIQNPLFSLNSERIAQLFEAIDESKGVEHGDLLSVYSIVRPHYSIVRPHYTISGVSVPSHTIWREKVALWPRSLPADYEFGVPICDEQLISVINAKDRRRMIEGKKKERVKSRENDGKTWVY